MTDMRIGPREIEVAAPALVQVQPLAGGALQVSLRATGKEVFCDIELHLRPDTPAVEFSCRTVTNRGFDVELFQQVVVFEVGPRLAQLFLKNRKSTRLFPRARYWLDKQGVRFGAGEESVWLYHTPAVSSIEVEPKSNRLFVNLDKADDHPMMVDEHDTSYRDASAVRLTAASALETKFSISIGYAPPDTPRLMIAPNCRLATHVWTEHACYTDLRVHRAVYFGDERIEKAIDATGGFVRHGIPVTKSVFFDNPDGVANDGHSPLFTGPQASLCTSPGMPVFLEELRDAGHEICLHCVQPNTSAHDAVEEALAHMGDKFGSVSWIDHFWYHPSGEKRGCAESFCCRGQVSYSHDLWRKAGVRYFWNPFYEYEPLTEARPHMEVLNHWHWNEAVSNPLYWRHPTLGNPNAIATHRNGAFISFPTWESWFPRKDSARYALAQLNSLIDDWGVALAHTYPTFCGDANLAWREAEDGSIRIGEEFDALLAHMAELDQRGLLWNTTLRSLLGRLEQYEQVSVSPSPQSGGVVIENMSGAPLAGLTFALDTKAAVINGVLAAGVERGGAYLFARDLAADEKLTIAPVSESQA
ncbi:MAG TPA: hypothetical protein VG735_03410 [Caulobacterales bacterium]|nr:hypothetical protein [Caulobacterales bacterium]